MSVDDIQRVTVLGAGNMGHGITEVVAMAGYEVTMRDIEPDLVEEGYENIEWSLEKLLERGALEEPIATILDRIETTTDFEEAVADADLVIEAVPERMDLKKEIFADLDEHTPAGAILASNTSTLSITEMATATDRPESVVGLHFFNPPVKMELVEVIYGEETADAVAETAYDFVESIGKTPIYVRKDVHGFVVNTVLGPFINEPAFMVSNGEAEIRQADAAMVHQREYPMGPFELSDLTGIDVNVHVREEGGEPVPQIMAEKEEAGDLGRKTGTGYYEYADGPGADYEPEDGAGFDTLRVEAMMANEAASLIRRDVATPEEIDIGVRLGLGFPEGICERADKIGLDTILEKLDALAAETGAERFEADPYLRELVESGRTGRSAGEGFHEYPAWDLPEFDVLNWDIDERGLLSVELDRPEKLNALSPALKDELESLFERVETDDVRCVTIEGAGDRAFCAGADVSRFEDLEPTDAMDVSTVYTTVADFERPVVALVDGYCLGGGLELALACDLRLATTEASFGAPEIGLGLIPGGGGTQRLVRVLGETRAKELVFRGNIIDAERAADWGLVNRAVDPADFDAVVEDFVSDLLEGPPIGLEVAKTVMNEGPDASLDASLVMESQGFGLLMSTEDVEEGVAAFQEDREPSFE
ncbi:MAG: 3-hydroxyacyl-CoA dehydrogenase/enoyl-CoA hydratase family protein, partial [Halodesulfurarchaeum sp.]